jgi:hypothetical protein
MDTCVRRALSQLVRNSLVNIAGGVPKECRRNAAGRQACIAAVLSLPLSCFRRASNRAHLDRRPTGDGSLAPPCKCIIQSSGFQHPKTAYVLIGLQVRPVANLVQHGLIRHADGDGNIVTVEPVGSVFTFPAGINDLGTIAGYYVDANGISHGFLRIP